MEDGKTAQQAFIRDLQAAREYKQVSLERVADVTHISLDYLRALEEGAWERIPLPFLRGYLTAYAECVGMVREKVLKRYDELDWSAPPAPLREELAPTPMVPRSPFPTRRPEVPAAAEPVRAPGGAESLVPSFWDVVPAPVKGLAAGALLVLVAALVGGVVWLAGGWGSSDQEAQLSAALEEGGAEGVPTMQGFAPFQFQVRLGRAGALRLQTPDGMLFDAVLPADSALAMSSSQEVLVRVSRLEDLRLWRDGRALDLPDDKGPAEVRVTRESVRVIRRTP